MYLQEVEERGLLRKDPLKTLCVLASFRRDDEHFDDGLTDALVNLSLLSGPGLKDIFTHIVMRGYILKRLKICD